MQQIQRITLLILLSCSFFSSAAFAKNFTEADIAERIAPVGDVYLQGEITTQQTEAPANTPATPRNAKNIYNTYCVACHATGAAGAPIRGDNAAWQPRLAQGQDLLLKHAINGFNAMPARGTCADCSDDEMADTVAFLIKGL